MTYKGDIVITVTEHTRGITGLNANGAKLEGSLTIKVDRPHAFVPQVQFVGGVESGYSGRTTGSSPRCRQETTAEWTANEEVSMSDNKEQKPEPREPREPRTEAEREWKKAREAWENFPLSRLSDWLTGRR